MCGPLNKIVFLGVKTRGIFFAEIFFFEYLNPVNSYDKTSQFKINEDHKTAWQIM